MKKLIALLLMTTTNAYATPDCRELPTCESLGYICSAKDCGELKTLSCPFDTLKKVCWPKEKDCEVGDVLYNDLKCYNSGCGKTPIAIVAETTLRLAVALDKGGGGKWGDFGDIEGLENCENSEIAEESCATDGKANTLAIMKHKENHPEMTYLPIEYCYNFTLGDFPKGSWFVPSVREIRQISYNIVPFFTAMDKYGFHPSNFWASSNEKDYNNFYVVYVNNTVSPAVGKQNGYGAYCTIKY